MMKDEEPRLWPVHRAAKYMGIHVNTLKRIPPEELPYYSILGKGDRRYHPDDVEAYLQRHRVTTSQHAPTR